MSRFAGQSYHFFILFVLSFPSFCVLRKSNLLLEIRKMNVGDLERSPVCHCVRMLSKL